MQESLEVLRIGTKVLWPLLGKKLYLLLFWNKTPNASFVLSLKKIYFYFW
jgi:hypothetical protein